MADPSTASTTSETSAGGQRRRALKRALELHKRSREDFSKAHRDGMAALERHDYRA